MHNCLMGGFALKNSSPEVIYKLGRVWVNFARITLETFARAEVNLNERQSELLKKHLF